MYEIIIFVLGFLFATTIIYFLIPTIVMEVMSGITISIINKSNDEDEIDD